MPGLARSGIQWAEPLIFERGASGRTGASLPACDVPEIDPKELFGDLHREASEQAGLPDVSEPEAFRHYVRLKVVYTRSEPAR